MPPSGTPTVNGLVREFLTGIAAREDRARQARSRIRQMSRRSAARLAIFSLPAHRHLAGEDRDREIGERYRISYWDAAIVAAAEALGATTLYTEDLDRGQRYGTVVARNPFA